MTINVKKAENHPEHTNLRYTKKNFSAEEIERFRSLLGDGNPPPVLNNTITVEQAEEPPPASTVAAKPRDMTLIPTVAREPDAQILSLRISTGPLAGMLVQASWQGNKLNLKFSDLENELSERLLRESDNIGTALSRGLGYPIVIEVDNAH